MLTTLSGEISKADETMRDSGKFSVLDINQDGKIEKQEIIDVILTYFSETHTKEEALVIATKLDPDDDGIISMEDLENEFKILMKNLNL